VYPDTVKSGKVKPKTYLANFAQSYETPEWRPTTLCEIVQGQIFRGQLEAAQAQAMIRNAVHPLHVNLEFIDKNNNQLGLNLQVAVCLCSQPVFPLLLVGKLMSLRRTPLACRPIPDT
jgi:hypothetical protein